jgi:hypothetical protein
MPLGVDSPLPAQEMRWSMFNLPPEKSRNAQSCLENHKDSSKSTRRVEKCHFNATFQIFCKRPPKSKEKREKSRIAQSYLKNLPTSLGMEHHLLPTRSG